MWLSYTFDFLMPVIVYVTVCIHNGIHCIQEDLAAHIAKLSIMFVDSIARSHSMSDYVVRYISIATGANITGCSSISMCNIIIYIYILIHACACMSMGVTRDYCVIQNTCT